MINIEACSTAGAGAALGLVLGAALCGAPAAFSRARLVCTEHTAHTVWCTQAILKRLDDHSEFT